LAQELGHIYGLIPNPFKENIPQEKGEYIKEVEEEIIKVLGIAFGVSGISMSVIEVGKQLGEKEAKEIMRKKIEEKTITKIVKEIAKVLGVKVTKEQISKTVTKIIPVIGGVTSGLLSYKAIDKIGNNLKENFSKERELIRKKIIEIENAK